MNEGCKSFYETSYETNGFGAQRRYPNEELMRFMGRTLFSVPWANRKEIRVLEVGCGSGGNLWAIAREGFDTYGIDLSAEGINLCQQMLTSWDCSANLQVGDMADLPYEPSSFDVVVDIFSSNCLAEKDFKNYLDGIARVLKPGGKYFSYTPSKNSDVFKQAAASDRIDASTLNGIRRPTAPFYGNFYPFRFTSGDEYAALLAKDFRATYNETVGRTYRDGREYFEFVVIQADRK